MSLRTKTLVLSLLASSLTMAYAENPATSGTPAPARTNPDMSVNALFLGRMSNKGQAPTAEASNGFHLQEVELRFTSNIDTYFRGEAVIAIEKEPGQGFEIVPEEAYAETLSIPSLTFRVGKFKAFWGKHNQLHTHASPFIDAPLSQTEVLGEEGINEVGLAAAILLPTPWYFELVPQIFSTENDVLFNSRADGTNLDANNFGYLFFAKNLFDLSDSTTFELDLGYGFGENAYADTTTLMNAAITLKWRPTDHSTAQSFSLTSEFNRRQISGATADSMVGALSNWVQYQLAQRWWVQARYEMLNFPAPDAGKTTKTSALLGYVPTEYSALRLQYDLVNEAAEALNEHRVTLQLNVSLGTHPAHTY